jgi:hypothetical protein
VNFRSFSIIGCLLAVLLALAAPAAAQNSGGSAYSIGGIDVDVAGPNAQAARMAAFRIAQRKAWPILWSRLTGASEGAAPRLTDSQLDSMVSGIESQGERFSTTRYIARLGVVFDRSRAAPYLGATGAGLRSPPMLLLPKLVDGGAAKLYHAKTPWLAAWNRFRETVTPLDYVLASGSPGDNMLLTGWQVHRPDRESWRNILTRFDTVQVLTAEARLHRSWPGGPISGLFIARAGPEAGELGRFTLNAQSPEGLDAMLDTAVQQIDMIYAAALRSGRLQSEPDLSQELAPLLSSGPLIGAPPSDTTAEPGAVMASIELFVPTPDAATAASIEAQLRSTPGITAVTTTSLSLGGTSQILISFNVSRPALDYALDGKALRITVSDNKNILRRRLPTEVPLPPPAPPAPVSDAPSEIPIETPPVATPTP